MATYKELKAEAEKLLAQAEELRKQETEQVISDIREKIKTYGLTAADLGFAASRSSSGARAMKSSSRPSSSAVYEGPNGQTWSGGRGRRPKWLTEALASGKRLEDFQRK